jgi:hypothetical protein
MACKRHWLVVHSLLCVISILGCSAPSVSASSGGGHALVGAALGPTTGSVEGAFAVGLASHTLLDAMPHWEYNEVTQVVLLAAAGAFIRQEFSRTGDWRLIAGAAGGVLPDLPHVLRRLGWKGKSRFPSHDGTLPHGRAKKMWQGIWLEAGLVGAIVSLAF